ncbi:MAG: hypothetical protein Q4G18_03370 [Myroides sp.]|nr:hypothetical protein [Myroides sp.]
MADNNFITQTLLFAAEVGKDINTLRKQLGKLSDLTTDEQASIVLAINELKNSLNNLGDVTSAIPDWSTDLENNTNF